MLSEGGFASDILSSAEEALTLFRGGAKDYKALVADVSLKGRLSGWEIARQVRDKKPSLPVVYMTAAGAEQWSSQGVPNSVVAEAGSVVEGKSLAEIAKFDIAVLDINIAGLSIQPVAETIAARGLPFFFVSGYRSGGIPDRFRGTPLVPKPVEFARLNETIRSVLSVSGEP